jgi:hypothetical protein
VKRRVLLGVVLTLVSSGYAQKRNYSVYDPNIVHGTAFQGRLDAKEGEWWNYAHCASLEYFDGKFHALWNAHWSPYEHDVGQELLWATSEDFVTWTDPVRLTRDAFKDPMYDPKAIQWQPDMLKVGDELWAFWYIGGLYGEPPPESTGTYLSVLKKGETKWSNRRLFVVPPHDAENSPVCAHPVTPDTAAWVMQKSVRLESGRIIVPLIMVDDVNLVDLPLFAEYNWSRPAEQRTWNMVVYSDDDGKTWMGSNLVSDPAMFQGQWECTVYEQADGKLRMFSKNRIKRGNVPPAKTLLTTVGTGTNIGEPIVFQPDMQYTETENWRPRVCAMRLESERYVMLRPDAYTPETLRAAARYNMALNFSRTGENDYVAGPAVSESDRRATYPAMIERNGKIYMAWTDLGAADINWTPRRISTAVAEVPAANRFYIWPRDKEIYDLKRVKDTQSIVVNRRVPQYEKVVLHQYERPEVVKKDGRDALRIRMHGTAGVETDPVRFESGDQLIVNMRVHISELQKLGNLILCSFGDTIPVRIGVPSNRPESLYVYCSDGWRPAGSISFNKWSDLKITFGKDTFSIQIDDGSPVIFENTMRKMNPRFYLGDGYETDFLPSNLGSEFFIDLASFTTEVLRN